MELSELEWVKPGAPAVIITRLITRRDTIDVKITKVTKTRVTVEYLPAWQGAKVLSVQFYMARGRLIGNGLAEYGADAYGPSARTLHAPDSERVTTTRYAAGHKAAVDRINSRLGLKAGQHDTPAQLREKADILRELAAQLDALAESTKE